MKISINQFFVVSVLFLFFSPFSLQGTDNNIGDEHSPLKRKINNMENEEVNNKAVNNGKRLNLQGINFNEEKTKNFFHPEYFPRTLLIEIFQKRGIAKIAENVCKYWEEVRASSSCWM